MLDWTIIVYQQASLKIRMNCQGEPPTVILILILLIVIVQAVLHACHPGSFAALRGASVQTRLVADQLGRPRQTSPGAKKLRSTLGKMHYQTVKIFF